MDAISNWVTSPKTEIKLAKPKGELRQKRKKKLARRTECREQQKDDKKRAGGGGSKPKQCYENCREECNKNAT